MDAIEPVRPSPPAIAPIDATRVRRFANEREGSAEQRRRRQSQQRDAEAAQDAGEELPSVVVDAGLLDGSRARDASERGSAEPDAFAQEASEPDAFAQEASEQEASEAWQGREQEELDGHGHSHSHGHRDGDGHGDEHGDGHGDGPVHIDLTV